MRRSSWLLVLVFGTACGDTPSHLDADAAVNPGIDAAVNSGIDAAGGSIAEIDPDRMMADVVVLASTEYGGRQPGTAGGALALDYVEAAFTEAGLSPAGDDSTYRQHFSFGQWQQDAPSVVTLDATAASEGSQYILLENSGAAEVTGEMVFVGYGMTVPPYSRDDYPECPIAESGYDDYAAIDVTGKIAVVLRHGPNDNQAIHDHCPASNAVMLPALWEFGYKAANARYHGALAMLMVQDYPHGAAPFEGTISDAYYAADFPALAVDRTLLESHLPQLHAWADAIDNMVSPGAQATGVSASVTTHTSREGQDTANLIAVLPGTDPEIGDQVVLVGAHLDHLGVDPGTGEIHRGADDNASGTAVVMELARVAAEVGLEPARTVIFAAFNAEESGLYGSCFTANHLGFPADKIVAMISVDMVGAGDGSGLDLYGTNDAQDGWLAELMAATAAEAELPYTPAVADELMASDHVCFVYAGVTAVLASTPGPHAYYHTFGDTADTILPGDLEAAASLMWVTLRALAGGEERDYLRRASPAGGLRRATIDPRRVRQQ